MSIRIRIGKRKDTGNRQDLLAGLLDRIPANIKGGLTSEQTHELPAGTALGFLNSRMQVICEVRLSGLIANSAPGDLPVTVTKIIDRDGCRDHFGVECTAELIGKTFSAPCLHLCLPEQSKD